MSKSAKSTEGRKGASTGQLWLRLPGMVRGALYRDHRFAAWQIRENDPGRWKRLPPNVA
jgi:hypothetical protein